MNDEALLKRFDLVADFPENIPLIRRYIVDLAIRGRLVVPSPDQPSPEEMLHRIAQRATELAIDGHIKKQKPLPPIETDELPVAYADHCTFERLGNIATLSKGLTGIQAAQPGPFPLVVTAADRASCDHYDFDGTAAIIPMVSSTGHGNASLNRLHYQEGKFALGTILCAVFPIDEALFSARFLFEYLTAFKEDLLVARMIGTANVTLTIAKIAEVPVPVLPPAAQQRVDELMTLCDQLETALQERERYRDGLVAASLQRLNLLADNQTRLEHTRFHLEHLPRLTTRPEHMKGLRQTIRNLAVRGLIVSQNSGDEPAAELLKSIRKEKIQLLKSGAIPKEKTATDSASLGFMLPAGWETVGMGDVCNLITSGSRGWAEFYAETGPKFLRAQNIRFGRLRMDELACVNPPANSEGIRTQVQKGDLLIVITGAGVTNPALLEEDLGEAYVSQHIALVRPTNPTMSRWLLLCLMADPGGHAELVARAYGAGKPGLNLGNIRSLSVPIPPFAEQERIVTKVDELIALCDELEAQLNKSQAESGRLLENLLGKAIGITRASAEVRSHRSQITSPISDHEQEKASHYMTSNPAATVDQLLECVDDLGGTAAPERLLKHSGLSEDLETFYDLLRAARDSGAIVAPLGSGEAIQRPRNAH